MLISYVALIAGSALLFVLGTIGGILLERDPEYAGGDVPRYKVRLWLAGVAVATLLSVPLLAQP